MTAKNTQDLPATGRLIAFDVGEKVIGIAISDSARRVAQTRPPLIRKNWQADKQILQKLCEEYAICGAVIGLPLNLDGSYSATTTAAQSFADLINKDLQLPVFMWDERLTSRAAETALFEHRTGRQTRASRKDTKRTLDSAAATLILQGFLDKQF